MVAFFFIEIFKQEILNAIFIFVILYQHNLTLVIQMARSMNYELFLKLTIKNNLLNLLNPFHSTSDWNFEVKINYQSFRFDRK